MTLVRTVVRVLLGAVLLLAVALWLFSPGGPLGEPAELTPGAGRSGSQVRVLAADWSADARRGLTLSRGDVAQGNALLWHRPVDEGGTRAIETGERQIWKGILSPDGFAAYLFGDSGEIFRIDLESERRAPLFPVPRQSSVGKLAIAPDGLVIAAAIETDVLLLDAQSGKELGRLPPSTCEASCLRFSDEGRYLAVGTDTGLIRYWDRDAGRILWEQAGHDGAIAEVCLIPGTGWLASAGLIDDRLRVFEEESGEAVWEQVSGQGGIRKLAISPDGQWGATGGTENGIGLWNLQTRVCVEFLEGHIGAVNALRFTPSGDELLSAGDSTIRRWQVRPVPISMPVGIEEVLPKRGEN